MALSKFSSGHVRVWGIVLASAVLQICLSSGCAAPREPARDHETGPAITEAYWTPQWSHDGAAPSVPAEGAGNTDANTGPAVIFPAAGGARGDAARGGTAPKDAGISPVPADSGRESPTNPAVKNNPVQGRPDTTGSTKDYVRALAEELERNPNDKALRKKLICLYYFEGELARADELLKGTENWDDDEIHLLRALVSYRIGVNNVAMNSLEAVRRKWRGQFQLEVRNLLFCREVKGRSDVVRFEKYEFFPGQKGILLYFEVENFMCKEGGTGQYEVAIKASPTLVMRQPHPFDTSAVTDRPVSWPELPDDERLSFKRTYKNFVDELQMYIVLDLPKDLQPGNYALNLVVEDTLARKQSTQGVLEFKVR